MSETKMIKRLLPCVLTSEEVAQRAQELARAEIYRGQVESDFAAAAEDWKAQKKLWDSKVMTASDACLRLGRVVKTGEEEREVECSTEVKGGQFLIVRVDTGEIVIQRPATQEELQQSLPLEPDPAER